MTQHPSPTSSPHTDPGARPSPERGPALVTLWRVAGALALVHVVLFVAAAAITGQPTVHEGQDVIEHSFNVGGLGRLMAAGYLLVVGFLCLVPFAVFIARQVGRRTEVARWAAQTGAAAALIGVVIIVGAGFSAGAAAMWADDRGQDLQTVLTVNNIRNFSYFLALPFLGVFAMGTGIAALVDRVLTRWVGWGGVVVGAALVLAIPAAGVGIQYGMPLWLLWLLGTAVSLLRHDPAGGERIVEPLR
jgi:hypothetical protein